MGTEPQKTVIKKHPEAKGHGFRLKERGILVQVNAKGLGKLFILDKMVTLIGRGQDCQIRLMDDEISKVHCSIRADEFGTLIIEDEKSSNGTLINGKKLRRAKALNFGDRIVIGTTILRFLREEEL